MNRDVAVHAEVEKAAAFLAIVLGEQTGPLTDLQRDFLVSIQSALVRLAENGASDEFRMTADGQ